MDYLREINLQTKNYDEILNNIFPDGEKVSQKGEGKVILVTSDGKGKNGLKEFINEGLEKIGIPIYDFGFNKLQNAWIQKKENPNLTDFITLQNEITPETIKQIRNLMSLQSMKENDYEENKYAAVWINLVGQNVLQNQTIRELINNAMRYNLLVFLSLQDDHILWNDTEIKNRISFIIFNKENDDHYLTYLYHNFCFNKLIIGLEDFKKKIANLDEDKVLITLKDTQFANRGRNKGILFIKTEGKNTKNPRNYCRIDQKVEKYHSSNERWIWTNFNPHRGEERIKWEEFSRLRKSYTLDCFKNIKTIDDFYTILQNKDIYDKYFKIFEGELICDTTKKGNKLFQDRVTGLEWFLDYEGRVFVEKNGYEKYFVAKNLGEFLTDLVEGIKKNKENNLKENIQSLLSSYKVDSKTKDKKEKEKEKEIEIEIEIKPEINFQKEKDKNKNFSLISELVKYDLDLTEDVSDSNLIGEDKVELVKYSKRITPLKEFSSLDQTPIETINVYTITEEKNNTSINLLKDENISQKETKKIKEKKEKESKDSKINKSENNWICEFCEDTLSSKYRLTEHQKRCPVKDYFTRHSEMSIFLRGKKYFSELTSHLTLEALKNKDLDLLIEIKEEMSPEISEEIISKLFIQKQFQYLTFLKGTGFEVKEILEKLYLEDIKRDIIEGNQEVVVNYKRLGFDVDSIILEESKTDISLILKDKLSYLNIENFYIGKENGKVNLKLRKEFNKDFEVVLFYSEICKFSNGLRPIFKNLSDSKLGEYFDFSLLNINQNSELVDMSKNTTSPITYVPILIIYHGNEPLIIYGGKQTYSDIYNFLEDIKNNN